MPHNLRFVALLLGAGLVVAPVSLIVMHRQSAAQTRLTAERMTGGDVERGRLALAHFGCGACHVIEGIPGARGDVGPALDGIAQRTEIAGKLSNQPDNMIRWIRQPQHVSPGDGMPDLGVGDRDARDIAAYLYTLRELTPP
jgi:cytochrome c2